jgi:hypothetical protein
MGRSLSLLVAAGALLWASGCAHAPAVSKEEVRFVTEREQVSGCEHLGRVSGSSSLGGISAQRLGKARAEAEMRTKAGRLGADVVLVQSSHGGFFGAESVGDAYRCAGRTTGGARSAEPPRGEPAPPPAIPGRVSGGCEKDTDCKGDRVCESGRCVQP